MESESELDRLLIQLKSTVITSGFSRKEALHTLETLLSWLIKPENNTDANCRRIDYFVSYEIMPEIRFREFPDDIHEILFDLGGALHDTHTSPDIAENFESTPRQLLNRVLNL